MERHELADLIKTGLNYFGVQESKGLMSYFIAKRANGIFEVCPLGAAVVAKFSSAEKAFDFFNQTKENKSYAELAMEVLGIDLAVVQAIDNANMHGVSALKIIRKLEKGSLRFCFFNF